MTFEELLEVKNMRKAKDCCSLLMESRIKKTQELGKEIDALLSELIEIYRKDFDKAALSVLAKLNKKFMGKA